MSLYADYIKEREGREIVEYPDGFATFKIGGEECYIQDIYVVPDMRRTRTASCLADKVSEIAAQRGCKFLSGTVDPNSRGATTSLKVLLGYGFELHSVRDGLIWFYKKIGV